MRKKLDLSEATNHSQTNTVARLEARITALENELSNKDHLLSKTQDLLSSEQEQKSRLQEQWQRQTRHLEKVEKSLEKESEEVNKANEIIRRLQNEVKSHHTKAKLRGQVAAEQERLLSSKETELHELHIELERVKSDLKGARETTASLNSQLKMKSEELAEAQRTIKTNENIIGWLNRQISENQMGQMQQRLRSSGFPTPIPPLSNGSNRLLSPAFGTTAGWQSSTGTRLTNQLIPMTQVNMIGSTTVTTATMPGTFTNTTTSNSTTVLSSRPASSVLNYMGVSATAASTFPVSTLHQVPESENETDYGKSLKVMDGGSHANPSTLPAPMTKSTPLHGDHILMGRIHSSDGTARSVRPISSGANSMLPPDVSSRLPTYLPSALGMRSQSNPSQTGSSQPVPHNLYSDRVGSEATKPTTTSACSVPDESDRTLHQQSLSSAYFPKPIGTQAHR
ncbi:unnamed protein product [Echinostoma caproni]|uniref:SAS-6_N domain-containing protein n=1 Tax=Echinostoma caproni TaxID=27848 RepID=A0A3P8FWQ4_9TREM|nr:unnamed protein product [Echinostoma caproni]